MKINQIVKDVLQQHSGGKEFFETLDLAIRNNDIIMELYDKINDFTGINYTIMITTGTFGLFFSNWINCFGSDIDVVYIVNGKIREGEPIFSLECFEKGIKNIDFIIVDDSYYSGRTVETIKEHLVKLGGIYKGTFVVYDGSINKNEKVHSLYRYYESK